VKAKEILEQFDKILGKFAITEMAIKFGDNLSNNLSVSDGFKRIENQKKKQIELHK